MKSQIYAALYMLVTQLVVRPVLCMDCTVNIVLSSKSKSYPSRILIILNQKRNLDTPCNLVHLTGSPMPSKTEKDN